MAKARYEFATNTRYFAWPVAAKLVEFPSHDEVVKAVRVTLATPCFVVDGKPIESKQFEAVVWAFIGDDDEFLHKIEVKLNGTDCDIPAWKAKCLWVTFGPPEGAFRYQPIEGDWEIADAKDYPTEPYYRAVESRTGVEFLPGNLVKFRDETKKLGQGKVLIQILQVLDSCYQRPASVAEIRGGVTRWQKEGRPTSTLAAKKADRVVAVAVSKLKALLPNGLSISDRDGDNGWALEVDKS